MSSFPADADAGSAESPDEGALSPDAIFEVLADRRRRYTLYYLFGCSYPADVEELAEAVAAWEAGSPREAVTDRRRRRVALALHHVHLPKVDATGVVTYDRDSETVTLGPAAPALSPYVDLTVRRERDRLPEAVVGGWPASTVGENA